MSRLRRAKGDVDRVRVLMAEVAPAPTRVQRAGEAERRSRLLERIVGMRQDLPVERALTSSPRGTWTPSRRLAYAGFAAAAVLAIALVGVVQPWNTSNTAAALTPPPLDFEFVDAHSLAIRDGLPAADLLSELSATAAAQAAPGAHGQVQRVVTDSWDLTISRAHEGGSATAIVPSVSEMLVRADGSYTQTSRRGEALSPDGRSAVPDGTGGDGPPQSTDTVPAGTVDTGYLASLSRDPVTLRERLDLKVNCIAAAGSPARSRCQFRAITDLYGFAVIPPDLEAALWAELAQDTNLVDIGRTRDRVGRMGVGVALDLPASGPARSILIIDPSTGHLLGREDLLLGGGNGLGIETPAVVGFTAYIRSEWTN